MIRHDLRLLSQRRASPPIDRYKIIYAWLQRHIYVRTYRNPKRQLQYITLCVSFSFVFSIYCFVAAIYAKKRCIYNTNECDGDFRGRWCPAAGGQIFGQAAATTVKVAERRGRLVGSLPSTRSRSSVRYLSVSRRAAAVFDRRRRSRRRCRHLQAKRYRRRRRRGRINGTGRAGSIVGAVIMLITSCLLRSHTSHSKPIQQSCAGPSAAGNSGRGASKILEESENTAGWYGKLGGPLPPVAVRGWHPRRKFWTKSCISVRFR